jgi:F0F1-type ATP synthase assembly protein I
MDPKETAGRQLGRAWRYDALGYTFAFSIMLFAGAGYLLDRWLGLVPILTIAGTLVGTIVAITWVYLQVQQDERKYRDRQRADDESPR